MDAARFKEASHPMHLLHLMGEDVLESLLNGFAYKLEAAVAVLFSTTKPATEKTMRRRDPVRHLQLSHPFCQKYRTPQEQGAKCVDWDTSIALNYYKNEWAGPKLFRCPLQLWEMTYPLQVEGNLLGVLFGGQIVVDGNSVLWRNALAPIWQDVSLDPLAPPSGCQTEDILAALPREALPEHLDSLDELVRTGDGMKKVGAEVLIERYRDFLEFGRTVESLLTSFYYLKVDVEGRRLLQDAARELLTETTTPRDWWEGVASVIRSFGEATGTGPIEVYYRDRSRYVQVVDAAGFVDHQAARRVPVRHYLVAPSDKLIRLSGDSDTTQLAAHLGLEGGGWLFRYEPAAVDERDFSMVFVFREQPSAREQPTTLAEEFCRTVALRAQISDLLFRSVEDRQAFERRVRNISHAAKTPMMTALTEIRRAKLSLDFASPPDEIKAHIEKTTDAIFDASAEMGQMYSRLPKERRELDVRELLRNLANKMGPLAEARCCRITVTVPEAPLRSILCEAEVTVAFRNLLDNAIKYSFSDKEIRIEARVAPEGWAEIVFSNYGVGIPDDKREQILREGGRAEVIDPRRPTGRPGTGLGVPIAMEILHRHGGALDLRSRPASSTEPGSWLHFITRAIVTLPLLKEKR
jgi:signal transduction histidine kinase/ligand-binding sensor protein